ncbi:MAG: thioredoxin-dependent thiol peroxidase [bacterium]|nr:thioredoxin-dependent thiol peroxidase [bacterium]
MKKAFNFKLPDQNGVIHRLSDYKNSWVLVYFYPKDNTPGCTIEACSFRDLLKEFERLNCKVIGISVDSVESHKKFVEKYKLKFTLLSDYKKEVVKKYGVWGKKKFMGKEYEGTYRTSFLINPKGYIVKVYENVNPKTHAGEVIKDLESLTKSS